MCIFGRAFVFASLDGTCYHCYRYLSLDGAAQHLVNINFYGMSCRKDFWNMRRGKQMNFLGKDIVDDAAFLTELSDFSQSKESWIDNKRRRRALLQKEE